MTLISVLVGMILAFIGGAQLAIFGAQVYVANLVAIGMAREMGAMMAAVIMRVVVGHSGDFAFQQVDGPLRSPQAQPWVWARAYGTNVSGTVVLRARPSSVLPNSRS